MQGNERPAGTVAAQYAPKPRAVDSIVRDIPLGLLIEHLDPMRHNMDDEAMLELQADIRTRGLLQNLCVVPVMPAEGETWTRVTMADYAAHVRDGGRFRVAAGHRRLLACRVVQYDPVRCNLFVDLSVDEEAIMHSENEHRENTSDYDLAVLYQKWLREPGITEKEIQRRAGKSMTFVYDRVELLSGYQDVCMALHAKQINVSVARAINRCDEPEYAAHFLRMAVDQGASAKIVNAWVNERKAFKDLTPEGAPQPAAAIPVTAPAFVKIECLLCGDTQSYNLQTVMMCGADVERIRAARAAAESVEQAEEEK